MNSKNLVVLGVVAAGLAGAAYMLGSGSKPSGSRLNGKTIFPDLDISKVSRIDCGGLSVAAKGNSWVVESYQDYPVDGGKLTQNLMSLTELKVGQTARGKKLTDTKLLQLKDSAGGEVASVKLGGMHSKYGHGRYLELDGEAVLVTDTLEAFDGDPKSWVDTKIVDLPRISFENLANPSLTEEDFGFSTGVVDRVTIAGDTNRVITVGNQVKGGNCRYVKLDKDKWIYEVPEYCLGKFLPKNNPEKSEK